MSKDVFHIMFTLIRNQSVLVGGGPLAKYNLSLSHSLSLSLSLSLTLSLFLVGGPSGQIQSLCLSVSLSVSVNAWHYNTASAGLSRQVARRYS